MQRVTLIIFLTLLTFNCSNKEKEISSLNEQELAIEKKVEQLLAQMTLQEKVSQMINIGLPSLIALSNGGKKYCRRLFSGIKALALSLPFLPAP